MAVIKQGILGGFSGKVGSVVGTSWKGRAVMKAMPLSVANPKTTGQVNQRNKMTGIVELAKNLIGGSIALLDNPFSGNISGYNRFVKRNISAVSTIGVVDYDQIKMSEGVLGGVSGVEEQVSHVGDIEIEINFVSETSPYNLDTDIIVATVIDAISGKVLNSGTPVTTRQANTLNVQFSEQLTAGMELRIYVSAIRADKKYASNQYVFFSDVAA